MSKKVKRLFEQFQPEHYVLDLKPNREKEIFEGTVTIYGQKRGRPSQRLSLHQKDLKIVDAKVVHHEKSGDKVISIDRINSHGRLDELRLHSKEMIYPGRYTISVEFRGRITRPMNGIYPCFFNDNGEEKRLIATQFESHHAREVFPCIDEPEAKATFDLTLSTPKGEVVLANTPAKSEKTEGKNIVTTFETTPKMSTYLLAFVYGELKSLEAKTKHGVVVRTYATPNNVDFTEFALDTAVKCLEFYNDYFGIHYPLEKCDMVALPDFAAGAMENWGLITYREHALLVDPDNSSLSTKQYTALVIAHELAHQWFGNLVTMKWWTDLWLNEGFASWIEYLAVDHLFPDWQMWTQFIVDEQLQALKLDALEYTHPVEVEVNSPEEIRTIFDAISYSKGASVIHMLHDYLGAEDFKKGLSHYLKKHSHGNTVTDNLWEALEEIAQKPVKEFMHSWTSHGGYPVLKVNVDEKAVTVEQSRFYLNPKAKKHTVAWPVPLLAEHGDDTVLGSSSQEFNFKSSGQLKLNRGQSGFYRTIYNAAHQNRLGELVHRGKLAPLDRMSLLSDVFEAAKAGHTDTAEALSLLKYYEHEDNTVVWDVISANLANVRAVMNDNDLREDMKPFVRKLVAMQLKRLGWERKTGDSHFDKLLRPTILGMAAVAEEKGVVSHAEKLFLKVASADDLPDHLRASSSITQLRRGEIDPDLRGVIFGTVARRGGKAEFEKLLKLHDQAKLSEEKYTLAAAITSFRQPELIKRALELITSDHVRIQDVGHWVAYSFMNHHARALTWAWLVKQWPWLTQNLGSDMSFYRFPLYSARAFSDAKFLPEYKRFFNSVMTPGLERTVNQGIEIIEWQSAWRERDLKLVKTYFKNRD